MENFERFGLNPAILSSIDRLGFKEPTPIQQETIPHMLSSSRDLIALAQTGTGKTAAFGLPLVQLTDLGDRRVQTLILCPTRELCLQITKDLQAYAKDSQGLRILAVYGGAGIGGQIKALQKGVHLVVGTPGRVKDLIGRKKLKLGTVTRVVLDEADEMLTMGFKEDLDAILSATPDDKQTLLFSATMSKKVLSITNTYMDDPHQISVAKINAGADNVSHLFYMAHARDRYEVLKRIADMNPKIYGIVFCRTRRDTKDIANKLMQDGYNADAIHGDLSQAQREEVMGRFRSRRLQMLVATDVAARGLDVDDLTHIINYNLPDDAESYTHRSGRTGRAGKSGISIAIVHTREMKKIREIEQKSGVSFRREMIPSGIDICKKQLFALIDKIEHVEVDEEQIAPFLPSILGKLEWLDREQLIKHFVSAEFNRFLSYYRGAKDLNVQKGDRSVKGRQMRSPQDPTFGRVYINLGTKHNLHPARLIGIINQALRSGEVAIGKIEILKKFSFFEIEKGAQAAVVKALNGEHFEGVTLLVEPSQPKSGLLPKYPNKRKKKKKKRPYAFEDGRRGAARHQKRKQGNRKKSK